MQKSGAVLDGRFRDAGMWAIGGASRRRPGRAIPLLIAEVPEGAIETSNAERGGLLGSGVYPIRQGGSSTGGYDPRLTS